MELVDSLEADKQALEQKIQVLREQQRTAEAPKLTLPLPVDGGNSIHSMGDGYISDGGNSSKRVMTSQRFNSKLYAQKQLETMIDNRQSTMGKVYA